MEHETNIPTSSFNSEKSENNAFTDDSEVRRRLSFSSEKNKNTTEEPSKTCKVLTLQSGRDGSNSLRGSVGIAEDISLQDVSTCLKTKNQADLKDPSSENRSREQSVNSSEDKENTAMPDTTGENDTCDQSSSQDTIVTSKEQNTTEISDAEVMRRAQEEGHVSVVFPGTVTQEGCCRFVSEILKCILYQRQQLPMTYDQLVYSQKKQQASMQDKDLNRRPVQSGDIDWRKCQQTLQELEEVLQQLEVLFSLSRVPRVLLLMGGSSVLPKELYEINMEALVVASGDQCLRVSSCLRQLFRTLFVADLLSDTRPVRLMHTTVMVLAHRDCGIGWFRPKLQFKVPTRVKNQIIALSTHTSSHREARAEGSDEDYVWFQAPMTIKGFTK